MKKFLTILIFLPIVVLNAKEHDYEYQKGYYLSEIDSKEGSFVYPAIKFMMSFIENKPQNSIEHCTEEVFYEKDSYDDNFYYRFKEKVKYVDKSDLSKVKVIFTTKNNEERVLVRFPKKNDAKDSFSEVFKIKKINGKYKIYYVY